MKINIITLFPELFSEFKKTLPLKKAILQNKLEINLVDLRDFAIDERGSVDDKVYGGGVGMLLRIEPLYHALQSLGIPNTPAHKIILLSPRGQKFTQKNARDFSSCESLTFICGRYEGVDERLQNFVTDTYSLGDFVLSGGEIPTLAIIEATCRLIPGILKKEEATKYESFSENQIEHPQYTRPEEFMGLKVPEVLLSGDHKKIEKWKKDHSVPVDSFTVSRE